MASVSPSVQGKAGPEQHLSDEFVPLKLKWWYGCFGGNLPWAALYVNVGTTVLPGAEEGLASSLKALLCGLQAAARSFPFACDSTNHLSVHPPYLSDLSSLLLQEGLS